MQSQVLCRHVPCRGLYRRLPYEQSQVPTTSRSVCDRVKKAARNAAAERAAAVKDAVGHFEDVGYPARAQDITDEVTSVVPELMESVPDMAGKLTAGRNGITHHLVLNEDMEPPLADRIAL